MRSRDAKTAQTLRLYGRCLLSLGDTRTDRCKQSVGDTVRLEKRLCARAEAARHVCVLGGGAGGGAAGDT
jgi:hypothetical protein